jgi:hypothetical protein
MRFILLIIFFSINLLVVTYGIDIEQITISNLPDPTTHTYEQYKQSGWNNYPSWPPKFIVDMVHWWGYNFDPVLIARPVWWRATIWLDTIFFGPFYLFAIYAFIRGRKWIRIPCFIYSTMMFTNVTIILSEEIFGSIPANNLGIVLLANASWIIFPIIITIRMWLDPHPFDKVKKDV